MAALPPARIPTLVKRKDPEPLRSIKKALDKAIDRALEEIHAKHSPDEELEGSDKCISPTCTFTELESVTHVKACACEECLFLFLLLSSGEMKVIPNACSEGATTANLLLDKEEHIVTFQTAWLCQSAPILLATLSPSKVSIYAIDPNSLEAKAIASVYGELAETDAKAASLELNTAPHYRFVSVCGIPGAVKVYEIPQVALDEFTTQACPNDAGEGNDESHGVAFPVSLTALLSITEATSRSFLDDTGEVGSLVLEWISKDVKCSGIRLPRVDEGVRRVYVWWMKVNRLALFDIHQRKDTNDNEGTVVFSSELRVLADWILPGNVCCSDVCVEDSLLIFGLSSSGALLWDIEEGRSKAIVRGRGLPNIAVRFQRSPDGALSFVGVQEDGRVTITEVANGGVVWDSKLPFSPERLLWHHPSPMHDPALLIRTKTAKWMSYDVRTATLSQLTAPKGHQSSRQMSGLARTSEPPEACDVDGHFFAIGGVDNSSGDCNEQVEDGNTDGDQNEAGEDAEGGQDEQDPRSCLCVFRIASSGPTSSPQETEVEMDIKTPAPICTGRDVAPKTAASGGYGVNKCGYLNSYQVESVERTQERISEICDGNWEGKMQRRMDELLAKYRGETSFQHRLI